ncbi:MAG: hypothetical protein QNJ22_08370 [Desulfosarcinaceae bacterium]|nr:hypothetical protein [Desulfosarcinaceae bacterium]
MVAAVSPHSVTSPRVYLCQVDATTSCGACCGLYNVAKNDQPTITALLTERAARFAEVPREIGPIDAFARWAARRAGPPPLADFHHCPFLGLIGAQPLRVGCLLHPLARGNRGLDLRGLSYYGSFTCRTYFCPASRSMARRYQHLLTQLFSHWYPYGLIVTETRLVTLLLERVESRLGHAIDPMRVAVTSSAGAALRRLLTLKIDWPYRRQGDQTTARIHYLFNDGAHRRSVKTAAITDPITAAMHQELGSSFDSPDEAEAARHRLETAIDRAAAALAQATAAPLLDRSRHATR